jgi:WD40 repeat protein
VTVSSVGIEADGDLDLGRVNKWISGLLRCLAVSPDSRTLVAGSLGGDAMMVDIATGNVLATLPDHPTVWDFSGRGPKGGRPAIGDAHAARISWLSWQPGGDLLASGGQNGDVIVWPSPTSTRKPLMPTEVIAGTRAVATAAWLPDGRGLIVGRHDGTVELRTSVELRRSINAYRPTRTRTRPSTSTVS